MNDTLKVAGRIGAELGAAKAEIQTLRTALLAIDQRNDNPARFDQEIDKIVRAALSQQADHVRDAAQTEQQPAYVECRECTDCGHVGINDAHQTDATCAMCDWSGPSPVEDQCPDCGKDNVMGAACPKCSGRYRILAETRVAAPIAQTAPQPEQSGLVLPHAQLERIERRLTDWLELNCCECESGHSCGRNEVTADRDAIRAALSAQGAGDASA